jgi:acyl-CoA synthetase (AMP-forming)/AMP-acid ligase II
MGGEVAGQVQEWEEQRLKMPARLLVPGELPRNPPGKVLKAALRKRVAEPSDSDASC